MGPILSTASRRHVLQYQQRAKLCEEIKVLAMKIARSFQETEYMKPEVLTVISAMSNHLRMLKDMIEDDCSLGDGGDLRLYAQQFIAMHAAKNLNLNNFSKFIGYSPKYCSRLFKARTGETFSHYTTRLRIDMAVQMLLRTSQPMSVIAELTGFSDPFVFSHFFKRVVGHSPIKFRAGNLIGQERFSILQPEENPLTKRRKESLHNSEFTSSAPNAAPVMAGIEKYHKCNR